VGGVPPAAYEASPTLEEVALKITQLAAGKRLIGHGLLKVAEPF